MVDEVTIGGEEAQQGVVEGILRATFGKVWFARLNGGSAF
jgi:hypothetical protein